MLQAQAKYKLLFESNSGLVLTPGCQKDIITAVLC